MIYSGRPVFITGQRNKILGVIPTDGHAWVLDGYILRRKGTKSQHLFHCNWGWGRLHDGYYQAEIFHAGTGFVFGYRDFKETSSGDDDENYKYGLGLITYEIP